MALLKPTSCKDAIVRWEKDNNQVAAEATEILLQFQWPPIEKMDGALSTLVNCEKLSLSSNMIDKIAGIAGMRNLKILSLGRNYIKAITGVETVSDTLEELWISYNPIDKLKGIGLMRNLRVLYMSNCLIKDWPEFMRLQDCHNLRDLVMIGNPLLENQPDLETWRTQAANRLKHITKLDGIPIIRDTE
ncbi:Dynein light chain 1, axonemal [Eumeta japonica]|uniref:Dynein axonemal light chain 1 n=1 Tax=Eumeta variegata TaxID=151549 RepID=A0A4C1X2G8_EUMVA|nr:Dynein light chain 1, axonemal [Eumeta japonica]